METFAGPDGSFVLYGLTPGAYSVQAALEDVWVSKSVGLAIPADSKKQLKLTCPSPGGPVDVLIVDSDGQPVPFAEMEFPRVPGPLTDRCLPKTLRAAHDGNLHVEGLRAGLCRIEIRGFSGIYTIEVPGLPRVDHPDPPIYRIVLTK